MNVAFCYDRIDPARGGCETYIVDVTRRLLNEGHTVDFYACEWNESAMPDGVTYHRISRAGGPRLWSTWRFAVACEEALKNNRHDVTVGLNKTWGQDVLYPQGGLHSASFDYNLNKYSSPAMRKLARITRSFDFRGIVYKRLERRQYLSQPRPIIIVNSYMVRDHFQKYIGVPGDDLFVVRSAIDAGRFHDVERPKRRESIRKRWGVKPQHVVGVFAAMNPRLKGLAPLLHGVRRMLDNNPHGAGDFRLVVVGKPRVPQFQRLAKQLRLGEHVHFAGHCPDMRDAYFAGDFLVHPTFYDPCSLVVLEAFACGLPVITTRSNGASELMRPLGEGYVIDDPHDPERMAWSLEQLLDPTRRTACSKAALETSQRWTFDHHYRALVQVLQQAAARRAAA